jgi:hypothetical protein
MLFQEYTHNDTKILPFQCRQRFPKYHYYDLGNNNMGESALYAKQIINKMTQLKYPRKLLILVMTNARKMHENLLLICY